MKVGDCMKKNIIRMTLVCFIAVAVIAAFFAVKESNYNYGKDQGYLTGYSIGHTDKRSGEMQNSQKLAGSIVPYETGTSKWKGFMMGFPDGYADGYDGADLPE